MGVKPRRRRLDEGGQKLHEIRPGTIIDFPALTEQFALWPKTNGFGHPSTVTKLAITPGPPCSFPL